MNLNAILHFIASFIVIAFSIFVYLKNRKNIYFAIFGATIFIWLFASSFAYIYQVETLSLFWFKISYIGVVLIPISFYNFIFDLLDRKNNKVIITNYIIGLIFIFLLYFSNSFIDGIYKYPWGFYPKASILVHPIFLVFFNILFAISIISIFLTFASKTSGITASSKNKLKFLFVGSLFGTFGAIDFLPNYGINIYPFGFLFMVIFLIIYALAIIRYRLMDINLAIKKTMIYSISAGVLTSVFVVLVLVMTTYLSEYTGITSFWITVFAALIIAFLFTPLKDKIQTFIDKLFYKTTYDYYATIQNASHELASTFDKKEIYQYIVDTVYTTLKLKNAYLLSEEYIMREALNSRLALEVPEKL
jgi:hypothetical protein